MSHKILITGATGHIGKRLIPLLLKNNYKLVCIYNKKLPIWEKNKNIEWLKCDLKKV